MDPLFMLPKQPAPIFGRTTNFEYKKTLPDSVFQSFAPAGRHVFRWQNQAGEWWVPSQSYLRIRFGFCAVKDDGSGLRPIHTEDGVAPVMNLPPHLFSRMEYYMDGNKLSELQDYVPQIDTMKHRMMKSRAYMSAVGNRSCFWHPDFAARQKLITPNLGLAVNPSTLQNGDIAGQRIIMRDGKIFDSGGVQHETKGYVAEGCFFGKVLDANAVELEGKINLPSDVEIYMATVSRDQDGKSVTWEARLQYYGVSGVLAALDGKQVLLTMTYKDGKSRSVVATYVPRYEVFLVHKQTSAGYSPTGAAATFHINSSFPSIPSFVVQNLTTVLIPELLPSPKSDAALTATLGGNPDALNLVTDVIVTPLEPSQHIAGAARHEVCWKPTLGIFDVAHALPTTRHELHLQIPPDYQTRCFDFGKTQPTPSWIADRILDARLSAQPSFTGTDIGKVFLRIESIEYFAAMASGPRADDAKYVLDLREYRMMPQTIPLSQTTASTTYAFNLAPNTSSVSVAFQSLKAGNGSCSLSKFIVPTEFFQRGAETALQRFYVNFANQNRPREENESYITYQGPNTKIAQGNDRAGTTTQFFTQRYLETMTNTGQLFKPGGCETLEEWIERGAYYNWMWPRDGNDLSTRFHVFCAFEPAVDTKVAGGLETELVKRGWPSQISGQNNDVQILIFDMIPRAFSLTLRNGSVVSAETTSAMVADGVRRIRTE
jgi:hypothetical protein